MAGDAFEKIKSSVNRGITTISVKTSSSLEKSKIKTHIDTLKRDIEKEISLIGDSAYKLWCEGVTDYSSLFPNMEKVKEKYAEIEKLNAQLSSIDERDSKILGTDRDEAPVSKYICTNCGAQYDNPVNFCRKCGSKIEH